MESVCLHNGTVLTGFAAMERCAVLVEDGLVSDVFSQKRFEQRRFDSAVRVIDVNGAYIAPGFIDTHIHGIGGYGTEDADNGAPEAGAEAALAMSRLLAERGVTAFNPTLYPSEPEHMLRAVREIASAMGRETGARIMGLHLEGPFLSPARLGVQKGDTVRPVDIHFMEQLWEAAAGHIVNMTVAPELKGMRELALFCIKKGIVLQAGHTDAKYENMVEGMQAGILHSTHLFNAMSRLEHRNPNAVGAILIHPEMSCEIIADGLKPTDQTEGPLFANNEEVCFHDGAFHRVSDDVIAGSGLTMIRGIQNLVTSGFSLEDAVKTGSFNPAHVMRYNRQGAIIPGHFADLAVFDRDFSIRLVMVAGKIVKDFV